MDMADIGLIQLMLTAILGLSVGAIGQWIEADR
jgi:hypothetical protein